MEHQKAVERTTAMLKAYQDRHRKIEALRYRLGHPSFVTKEEIISQMSMPGVADTVTRHVSDKTMYIALNYEERANAINAEENVRIAEKLSRLEEEERRLLFHVALLPPRLAQALEAHYLEGLTWREIAQAEHVSLKAMEDRRARAVAMLAQLLFLGEEDVG